MSLYIGETKIPNVGMFVESGDAAALQSKSVTPTEGTQVVIPDTGYDGLSAVTVNPVSSSYVGTGITRNPSLIVNSNIVTAPAGYYSDAQSASVPGPDLGTKTVTANGTYAAEDDSLDGYSEFTVNVSGGSTLGTKSITENGTYAATDDSLDGYSSVTVNVSGGGSPTLQAKTNISPTTSSQTITADSGYDGLSSVQIDAMPSGTAGTPSATKGAVSNHSISVTPSVTNTTGYIIGGTKTGTAVSVAASELVSGALAVDNDGTYDVTNYASAEVAIDYNSKVREVTINATRTDTTGGAIISIYGSFGTTSPLDFSSNITTPSISLLIADGQSNGTSVVRIPRGRPFIVIGCAATLGNYDVTVSSTDGECVDVPHILGASSTHITKAIYFKSGASDQVTINVTLNSQNPYSENVVTSPLSVSSNGTYTPSSGEAYSSVTVNVASSSPTLQSKTNITPTTSSQTITADTGYDGLSSVQIDAMPSGSATTPATTVTANPTISVNSSTGLITATASASQNVTPTVSAGYVSSGTAGTITVSGSNTSQLSTQAAVTITPSESSQTAVAAGKYTTGAVTVAAISSTYVGSGIDQRDETDLTASGATVTVPAGYYAEQETKSVASGTEGTPTASKGTVSNNSVTVTPSVTNSAGYISGGTHSGTSVTVSASELVSGTKTISSSGTTDVTNYASASVAAGTVTAPSTISGTSATVSTGTNTLTLTKTVSVTPNVSTAGYISSGTAGNASVSLTASVTTKAAATITPGTTDQTISSGTYLTGTQTISGDADLVASNIVSTANIFGVQGSVVVQHYYTGSSAPSSSLGSNGDIYFQTSS